MAVLQLDQQLAQPKNKIELMAGNVSNYFEAVVEFQSVQSELKLAEEQNMLLGGNIAKVSRSEDWLQRKNVAVEKVNELSKKYDALKERISQLYELMLDQNGWDAAKVAKDLEIYYSPEKGINRLKDIVGDPEKVLAYCFQIAWHAYTDQLPLVLDPIVIESTRNLIKSTFEEQAMTQSAAA